MHRVGYHYYYYHHYYQYYYYCYYYYLSDEEAKAVKGVSRATAVVLGRAWWT